MVTCPVTPCVRSNVPRLSPVDGSVTTRCIVLPLMWPAKRSLNRGMFDGNWPVTTKFPLLSGVTGPVSVPTPQPFVNVTAVELTSISATLLPHAPVGACGDPLSEPPQPATVDDSPHAAATRADILLRLSADVF